MKISEMLADLATVKEACGDLEVIVASDTEGNSFHPVDGFALGHYHAETEWYGDFYGQFSQDVDDPQIDAIVFWPVG